nr:hypothetical protein [Candidatus Sigynarchaeum springense]
MEEMMKRYVVVVGKSPLTEIFHFAAGSAAREFAGKLAGKGIKATIIVEDVS